MLKNDGGFTATNGSTYVVIKSSKPDINVYINRAEPVVATGNSYHSNS